MIKFKEFAPKTHQFQDHKPLRILSLSFWEQRVNHTSGTTVLLHFPSIEHCIRHCCSTRLLVTPLVVAGMHNIFKKKTDTQWNIFFFTFSSSCNCWPVLHLMVNKNTWESRGRRFAALLETRHKQKHASQVWQMPQISEKDYFKLQFTIRVSTCSMIHLFNQNSYFSKATECPCCFHQNSPNPLIAYFMWQHAFITLYKKGKGGHKKGEWVLR